MMCLFSLLIACIEMVVVSIFSSFAVAHSLNSQMVYSFDIRGILLMMVIAFSIAFFSSFWVSNKVTKLNPLEVLKK